MKTLHMNHTLFYIHYEVCLFDLSPVFLMYSHLSTWQTGDHFKPINEPFMGDGFNISKVTPPPIKVYQIPPTEGSFPLPKYPKQGLGRVVRSSTSNIQYEFLLHNWLKLALR